jgi:threonine/homoserine/homoserine lactone efflux protein
MFTTERAVKRLNRAAGGVMVAAGVAIATRS